MTKITAVINVASGLHARPANVFIKAASQFKSTIKVAKDDKEVDGKRLLAIMALGIRQGECILITADGEDEKEAIAALQEIIEKDFK